MGSLVFESYMVPFMDKEGKQNPIKNNKPSYIRIPKGSPSIDNNINDYMCIGKKENDNLLVSYGTLSNQCIELSKKHINTSALILNKLYPLEEIKIFNIIKNYNKLIVIEDHFAHSGIYSQLVEILYKNKINKNIISLAPNEYTLDVGNTPDFYFNKYNLSSEKIENYLK